MKNGGEVFDRVTGTPINYVELSPRKGDARPYMFAPEEVLIDTRDRAALTDRLRSENFEVDTSQEPLTQEPAGDEAKARPSVVRRREIERSVRDLLPELGLERWVRAPGLAEGRASVPDLVVDLRTVEVHRESAAADDAATRTTAGVWPVYVAHGEPDGEFGPATSAQPVDSVGPAPQGSAGRGVRVGVVDTGAFLKHEWLRQRALSRGAKDDEILDDDGNGVRDFEASHGSFIAGVILRHAPAATVIARAALDSQGIVKDTDVAAAIATLRHENIDILNLSLGGYADPDDPEPFPTTFRILELLRQDNPNLIVVAAAGNDGVSDPFFPAAWPTVIGVGALDSDNRPACFSNRGPWVTAWANGVDVVSCYNLDHTTVTAGAVWSGTSFAAPRVAGAIAAAMSPA